MKLLLDTHILLWAASNPDKLSRPARVALTSAENELFVSAATTWEISIKHSLGKLELPMEPERWVSAAFLSLQASEVPISIADSLAVSRLPSLHSDPFDRLLIAQAQRRVLTLVTSDPHIRRYPGLELIE